MGVTAMKKVIAKRWLNVEGKWHKTGEAFEVKSLAGIPADSVEVLADEPEAVAEPEKAVEKAEEPKQETTRRRNSRK